MAVSAVLAGLYISLYQCSLSAGLEHCFTSVTLSRQMDPMCSWPRPPEPWFRMPVRWQLQTPLIQPLGCTCSSPKAN